MKGEHQRVSHLFHLLSHPARLQILDELRRDPACVCHLQALLNRPQAYVSQQLSVLREAGVVTDRRDGLFIYYRLADRDVERLIEVALGPAGERSEAVECSCPHCSTK